MKTPYEFPSARETARKLKQHRRVPPVMLRQRSFAEAVRSIITFLDVSPQVMLRKTHDAAFIVHTAHPHLRFLLSSLLLQNLPNQCRTTTSAD